MATSKQYLEYILEQLSGLEGITCRSMMGEYIVYYHGKIAAYVCDDRLLVKPLKSALEYMPNAVYEPPYEGAKDMLLVENVDSASYLTGLFEVMYEELPESKKRKTGSGKEKSRCGNKGLSYPDGAEICRTEEYNHEI